MDRQRVADRILTAFLAAAYLASLALDNGPCLRYAVELHPDGTYKACEYKDRGDRDVFLAALAIYNWRKNHGISD